MILMGSEAREAALPLWAKLLAPAIEVGVAQDVAILFAVDDPHELLTDARLHRHSRVSLSFLAERAVLTYYGLAASCYHELMRRMHWHHADAALSAWSRPTRSDSRYRSGGEGGGNMLTRGEQTCTPGPLLLRYGIVPRDAPA